MKFNDMQYCKIDLDTIQEKFKKLINNQKQAKSQEEAFEVHKNYYALYSDYYTNSVLAYIRNSQDVTNKYYEEQRAYFDEIGPIFAELSTKYYDVLLSSPYKAYLESKISKVAFENMELSKKSISSDIIELMQEENALRTKYAKMLAEAKIEYEGNIFNLPEMEVFLYNEDRDIRLNSHKARADYFTKNKDEFDNIFDALVKNRTEQAKRLGYENFIELGYMRNFRTSYNSDMVRIFREGVKKYVVPYVNKIDQARKENLGLDKLHFIDSNIYFKNGNPKPITSFEGTLNAAKQMYNELSPETAEFINFMLENELFDVFARKNKNGGGYMEWILGYKSPFVLANFNGTSGDVDVMTHECGHAFQGYINGNSEIMEHLNITMETAEVHSMSMEYFTENWMNMFFGDRTDDYKFMHDASGVGFLPYGCMVDEFQHIVYENYNMSPKERNDAWLELEKQYRPNMNYDGLHFFNEGRLWQRQSHIYEVPFYYIDYCIAQVCAMQFYNLMKADFSKAWNMYIEFCKLGARDYFTNMVEQVGLQSPFNDDCIKSIMENYN